MPEPLPVSITLAGLAVLSETRVLVAGAHVLAFSTTIKVPQAPYTLYSTYLGQRGEETGVNHLLLAPGVLAPAPPRA